MKNKDMRPAVSCFEKFQVVVENDNLTLGVGMPNTRHNLYFYP